MNEPARGFVFDLDRCTGCHACVVACSNENELPWGESWRQVVTFNAEHRPALPTLHLSLACNHCAEAPCMRHCPALAIRRDAVSAAVLIEPDRCIGCGYCGWACPYDAPRYDHAARVMTKCTWCNHRLTAGREPACVELCPTTALRFGALEGEASAPGFPDTPAQPAIRFQSSGGEPQAPECTWQPPAEDLAGSSPATRGERAISLRSEWPLWLFTTIVAGLVGANWATLLGVRPLHVAAFLVAAVVAAVGSTLHLGQKLRAWRALLNLRGSWLSREIAAFGTFVALEALHLSAGWAWLGAAAAIAGLFVVFSIDRVYDVVRPRGQLRLHSGDTVLIAAGLATLLTGNVMAFALVAGIKLVLYVDRKRRVRSAASPRALVASVRLLGLALPLLLLAAWPSTAAVWATLVFAVGEGIDRLEFYGELEVVSPHRQARLDAASVTATSSGTDVG